MSAPTGPALPPERPTAQLEQAAIDALRVPLAPIGDAVNGFVGNMPQHSPLGRLYTQGAFLAGLPAVFADASSPMFRVLGPAAMPLAGMLGRRVFDGIVGERPGVWDDVIGSGISGAGAGAGIGSAFPGIGTTLGAGLGLLGGAALGFLQGDGSDDEDRQRALATLSSNTPLHPLLLAPRAGILPTLMGQRGTRPVAPRPSGPTPPSPPPPLPPAARTGHVRVPLDQATMDAYAAQVRAFAGMAS